MTIDIPCMIFFLDLDLGKVTVNFEQFVSVTTVSLKLELEETFRTRPLLNP